MNKALTMFSKKLIYEQEFGQDFNSCVEVLIDKLRKVQEPTENQILESSESYSTFKTDEISNKYESIIKNMRHAHAT